MSTTNKNPKRPKRYKPDRLDASAITPEIAAKWWYTRFGEGNPQRLNNPLWEWLVRTRMDPYDSRERFGLPSAWDDKRDAWCFDRLGQSVTPLPDGRIVMIGGEHEDSGFPDFHIYNDVTVQHPDGSLDIYGYPESIFPPTDFHSATLIGNRIIIIGNIGYTKNKNANTIQVAELNIETWAIRLIATHGETPGWLHKQVAELSEDGKIIQVRGGLIYPARDEFHGFLENPDPWSLDTESWEWKRLTQYSWETHVLYSTQRRTLPFSALESLLWAVDCNYKSSSNDKKSPEQIVPKEKWPEFQSRFGQFNAGIQADAAKLYGEGFSPDLEIMRNLFHPPLPHEAIPKRETDDPEEGEEYDEDGPFEWDEEDYSRAGDDFEGTRIEVQGVTVRYKDDYSRLTMVVEGKLPADTVAALLSDLKVKLESLLNLPITVEWL